VHRKNKKVLYGDTNIRTHEGLKNFSADYHLAFNYLDATLANRRHTAVAEADALSLER
jgi:hypothetical protein